MSIKKAPQKEKDGSLIEKNFLKIQHNVVAQGTCMWMSDRLKQKIFHWKNVWRNVNLESINMRIDSERQDLIDIDLMSHLYKKKARM